MTSSRNMLAFFSTMTSKLSLCEGNPPARNAQLWCFYVSLEKLLMWYDCNAFINGLLLVYAHLFWLCLGFNIIIFIAFAEFINQGYLLEGRRLQWVTTYLGERCVLITRLGSEYVSLLETKWPPFHRRYFQMHFLEWKCRNFDWEFTEFCSHWPN